MTLKKTLENIMGQGETAGNQHFLLQQRFLPFQRLISISESIYFVVCKCFQLGPV